MQPLNKLVCWFGITVEPKTMSSSLTVLLDEARFPGGKDACSLKVDIEMSHATIYPMRHDIHPSLKSVGFLVQHKIER